MDAYRLMFEKMDTPSYLLDQEGQLVDCNRQLLRFLGLDVKNENSIYNLFHQHGLWTLQQIQMVQQDDAEALVSGKKSTKFHQIIHINGEILYFEFVRTPLFDNSGQGFGLMVGIRDMTKQKRIEAKLKELEERLSYCNKFLNLTDQSVANQTAREKITKVLIVEDNITTQKVEDKLFKICHCFTDVVATLTQVKEIFKPGKYDLVLVDLGLGSGNGNGYQVTGVLREMEQGGQFRVPIIALTGADVPTVAFECEDSEMDGILPKPLTSEQANQLIQRYVRHANVQVTGLREFK